MCYTQTKKRAQGTQSKRAPMSTGTLYSKELNTVSLMRTSRLPWRPVRSDSCCTGGRGGLAQPTVFLPLRLHWPKSRDQSFRGHKGFEAQRSAQLLTQAEFKTNRIDSNCFEDERLLKCCVVHRLARAFTTHRPAGFRFEISY